MKINGLVYSVNDLTYNGTGTGEIRGLAISQNIRDTTQTAISSDDSTTTGNSRIKFNCANLTPRPGRRSGSPSYPAPTESSRTEHARGPPVRSPNSNEVSRPGGSSRRGSPSGRLDPRGRALARRTGHA